MSTVRVERCPDCLALVGEGMLYEHQQRQCLAKSKRRATLPKRTRLAIDLQAQASMLERFGGHGLNCGKLTALLRDAAQSLDSSVKPLELPKPANVPPKPVGPTNRTLREGEIPKRGDR